jgi:predicted SPOUT superfamily RNA methylase MTH1
LAEIEIPIILLIKQDGSLQANCSRLQCPELGLILNYKLKPQNLEKANNPQNNTLPYQGQLPLSEEKIYELLLP